MRMLENEGFHYENYVDIFDGGPTMLARTDEIKSVAESEQCEIAGINLEQGERAILATGKLSNFRACYGARALNEDGTISIDAQAADVLDVKAGDKVWSVAR